MRRHNPALFKTDALNLERKAILFLKERQTSKPETVKYCFTPSVELIEESRKNNDTRFVVSGYLTSDEVQTCQNKYGIELSRVEKGYLRS